MGSQHSGLANATRLRMANLRMGPWFKQSAHVAPVPETLGSSSPISFLPSSSHLLPLEREGDPDIISTLSLIVSIVHNLQLVLSFLNIS